MKKAISQLTPTQRKGLRDFRRMIKTHHAAETSKIEVRTVGPTLSVVTAYTSPGRTVDSWNLTATEATEGK